MKLKPARFRPRLLPVVITAGAGLLCLKVIGLWTQGGYILANPDLRKSAHAGFGRALTDVRRNPDWADDITGSTPPKKDKKEEPADAQKLPPDPKKAEPAPAALPAMPSMEERQILEKLGERRQQLDARLKELELREQLLKSAEKMLQDKLGELKESETRAAGSAQAKEQGEQSQMRSLVVMYEAMKPRDAAKVFERMDAKILMTLAQQMNPRKLSEVLSQMSPEAAEKLTSQFIRAVPQGAEPAKSAALPRAADPPLPAKAPAAEELPRLERGKAPAN